MSFCPYCGHDQESGVFCDECGLKIQVPRSGATPRTEEAKTLYTCPECGIATTEVFCPTCAIRIKPIRRDDDRDIPGDLREATRCPLCGTPFHGPACPVCGHRVSA